MGTVTRKPSDRIVEDNLTEYGRYVAEDRALSSLRDGLKPVQRRLLWTVWDRLKLKPGSTSKRSARVTGEVTGVFHPHGDASAYGALVTMTWQRYPLILGQGNFGNPMADLPPAAPRYTGVVAPDLLPEMFKDQVVQQMEPNYSGEFEEPIFIPTRLPLLLMNGSEGIAVGVSSRIPPHNLGALVSVLKKVLRDPDTKVSVLSKMLGGPDYAEGGLLLSNDEALRELHAKGRGGLTFQCAYQTDKVKNGYHLTVTSGCPHWSLPAFMEKCQALVAEGKLGWVSNESGEKVKVVCYARDVEKLEDNIVPLLFRRLTYNWIALDDDKKPVSFNLPSYCQSWLNTRRQTVKFHLEVRLKRLRRQQETEEAKLLVVQNLDEAITALRAPKPKEYALPQFFKRHDKNPGKNPEKKYERQTDVVLKSSMSLITRASEKRQKELIQKLKEEIQDVTRRLGDIDGVVLEELDSLKPYFDDRRTTCPL